MEERLPEAGGGDDFRSCCGDEEEWEDTEESFTAGIGKGELDETSVRLFFKGVSSSEAEGKKLSGIGVVMERSPGVPVLKVQKKLDFYVEELVAEHLALMDGLLVALQNGIRKIFAFTNSEKLYFQIAEAEILEDQLLVALGHRILELVDKLEDFDLILLPSFELERPLRLAKEAIGIRYVSPYEIGTCLICCEEKLGSQMIKAGCSHTFCYSCLTAYVEERLLTSKLPIRCPQLRCKYLISASECKSFLPVSSYDSLERAFAEAGNSGMERFYCPFPNCLVSLDLSQHFSRASSSSQSDLSCVECPECHRDICVNCGVPWHIMMDCDEYQSLPVEERDAGDLSLHRLAQNNSWRRCQRCRQMIEHTQGCFHMTCGCGHEFCYSCGADYASGVQTCQCVFWDEGSIEPSSAAQSSQAASEIWAWDTFDCMPTAVEGYSEQERAQLALIQRFLAGGFSLGDNPCQSPPRCADSYIVDTMKDLHQLPWLERFVSVISDSYNDDYIQ
ncbi:hypothetical protein QOZ80_5BG0447880 [Eleusine coracana subsp. coracana]|nr:hypothetical protein QOZ80_5BG0447880 [Eleusine coracana subsp. coracana]